MEKLALQAAYTTACISGKLKSKCVAEVSEAASGDLSGAFL